MDPIALGEDIPLHAGVPAAGLVPEVDASFQQGFHGQVFPDGRGWSFDRPLWRLYHTNCLSTSRLYCPATRRWVFRLRLAFAMMRLPMGGEGLWKP